MQYSIQQSIKLLTFAATMLLATASYAVAPVVAAGAGIGAASSAPGWLDTFFSSTMKVKIVENKSGDIDRIGALVQSILDYMAQLSLSEREYQAQKAPSADQSAVIGLHKLAANRDAKKYLVYQFPIQPEAENRRSILVTKGNLTNLDATQNPFDPFRLHVDNFCSKEDDNAKICRHNSNHIPNADLNAASLLSKKSLNTAKEQLAAYAFYRNLFPKNVVKAPIQIKGEKDKKYDPNAVLKLKTQWAGIARQSLGQQVFDEMLHERIPVQNLAQRVGFVNERDLANQGISLLPHYPNASLLELEEYEATWRYHYPSWKKDIATAPQGALLRELLIMKSIELKMQYEQNRKLDDIRALLAIMSSSSGAAAVSADRAKAAIEASQDLISDDAKPIVE